MTKRLIKNLRIKIKKLLSPEGVVGPHMSQKQWDTEFSTDKWSYLADENQKGHYYLIGELYNKHCTGNILDIGCGAGLLYEYMQEGVSREDVRYTGIDISQVAVADAKEKHPGLDFRVLNYETESLPEKFGAVIFNETLYYFSHSGKALEKCINEDLLAGGKIIVSMCYHERHQLIWQYIEKNYRVLDERGCSNEDGISWTVKVIEPL